MVVSESAVQLCLPSVTRPVGVLRHGSSCTSRSGHIDRGINGGGLQEYNPARGQKGVHNAEASAGWLPIIISRSVLCPTLVGPLYFTMTQNTLHKVMFSVGK